MPAALSPSQRHRLERGERADSAAVPPRQTPWFGPLTRDKETDGSTSKGATSKKKEKTCLENRPAHVFAQIVTVALRSGFEKHGGKKREKPKRTSRHARGPCRRDPPEKCVGQKRSHFSDDALGGLMFLREGVPTEVPRTTNTPKEKVNQDWFGGEVTRKKQQQQYQFPNTKRFSPTLRRTRLKGVHTSSRKTKRFSPTKSKL